MQSTVLAQAGIALEPGICAVRADHLDIRETIDSVGIRGLLRLVPTAAGNTLLLLVSGSGYLVPLSFPGVTVTPTPAIGFRAAALADITLDCHGEKAGDHGSRRRAGAGWPLLSRDCPRRRRLSLQRVKEHARAGPVPGPDARHRGQGRHREARRGQGPDRADRSLALLLETLYDAATLQSPNPQSELRSALLSSTLAAIAFSPEAGSMGYDAGQVFGGFAYSEDDLLSRSTATVPLPVPRAGYGAAARLNAALGSSRPYGHPSCFGGPQGRQGEPLGRSASRLRTHHGAVQIAA